LNVALAGLLGFLLEAMQHIDSIHQLRHVDNPEAPASSLIRISLTPPPMLLMGFQSSGSSPCCTLSIW
jgi:hypothetical protein